jgi:hypothetical protein
MDINESGKPLKKIGAGEGNRTLVFSLEGFRSFNVFQRHSDKSTQISLLNAKGYCALSERQTYRST